MLDLVNASTTAGQRLGHLGAPWAFFRRVRILAGGQVVEDIDFYNRVHQLFRMLTAKESIINDAGEAFGNSTWTDAYEGVGDNDARGSWIGRFANSAMQIIERI